MHRHAGSCAGMGERVGSRYADLMSSSCNCRKFVGVLPQPSIVLAGDWVAQHSASRGLDDPAQC